MFFFRIVWKGKDEIYLIVNARFTATELGASILSVFLTEEAFNFSVCGELRKDRKFQLV